MRPDNPRCETCVAWIPPAHAPASPTYPYHDGQCCIEPIMVPKLPGSWCMKHATPEEWQAKKGAWSGLADAYLCGIAEGRRRTE